MTLGLLNRPSLNVLTSECVWAFCPQMASAIWWQWNGLPTSTSCAIWRTSNATSLPGTPWFSVVTCSMRRFHPLQIGIFASTVSPALIHTVIVLEPKLLRCLPARQLPLQHQLTTLVLAGTIQANQHIKHLGLYYASILGAMLGYVAFLEYNTSIR